MKYVNTRHTAGEIINVSLNLTTENGRKVTVSLSPEDRKKILQMRDWAQLSYASYEGWAPAEKLQVKVISDTFKEGVTAKLTNLDQVYEAWSKAEKEYYDK